MNKSGKASEPSMDEILASIRKIIAEEPGAPRASSPSALASGASRRPEPFTASVSQGARDAVVRTPIALDDDLDDLIDSPVVAASKPVVPAPKPAMTAAAARLSAAQSAPRADAPVVTPVMAAPQAKADHAKPEPAQIEPSRAEPSQSGDLGAVIPRRDVAAPSPGDALNGAQRPSIRLSPSPDAPAGPVAANPIPAAAAPSAAPPASSPVAPNQPAGPVRSEANGAVRPTARMVVRDPSPADDDLDDLMAEPVPAKAPSAAASTAPDGPLASFSASLASQTARSEAAKVDARPEMKAGPLPQVMAATPVARPVEAAVPARDARPTVVEPMVAKPIAPAVAPSAARETVAPTSSAAAVPAAAPSQPAMAAQPAVVERGPPAPAPAQSSPVQPTPVQTAMPAAPIAPVAAAVPATVAAGVPMALAGSASRSLEDTVAELLRPMLRQWLDANMPRIVEKALRVELAQMGPKTVVVQKPPTQN